MNPSHSTRGSFGALRACCLTIAALAVSACSSLPPQSHSPAHSAQSEAALKQVEADYQRGDYGSVIRRVSTDGALQDAPPDTRVQALKLQAFSLCMNDHAFLCEEKFQQILALQPDFRLPASEQGHPLWGPVFERARQAR